MYHIYQGLESATWKSSKLLPTYTIVMEVAAKKFATSVAPDFKTEYDNNSWWFPTEMGIVSGRNIENQGIDPADYLSKKIDIIKYEKITDPETSEKKKNPRAEKHNPIY